MDQRLLGESQGEEGSKFKGGKVKDYLEGVKKKMGRCQILHRKGQVKGEWSKIEVDQRLLGERSQGEGG